MEYRTLGRTGVRVSPLCLGTMNFADRTPEEESTRILDRAIEAGINFVDTADFYGNVLDDGNGMGHTEERLGRYFANRGSRHRVVLATKFFAPTDRSDPNAQGGSRRHVITACEDSLRRLQTDYIDLYQMHRPDPSVPIDETLRALDDIVRSGKVRYIGGSSFPAWRIVEALWVSRELRLHRFVSDQPKYNLLRRGIEAEVVPMARAHEIALIGYQPLGAGMLSGKYRRGEALPPNSRFANSTWSESYRASYLTDESLAVVDVLSEIAESKGCSASQLAIAWSLGRPGITSVIIGPRTVDQLENSLGALDVEWTEEELSRIDRVAPGPNQQAR